MLYAISLDLLNLNWQSASFIMYVSLKSEVILTKHSLAFRCSGYFALLTNAKKNDSETSFRLIWMIEC